jgi:hypothetical protein
MASDPACRGVAKGPPAKASVWSSVGAQVRTEGLGSLAEALDRILCKGVVVDGAVTIGVADVELIMLDLRLLLAAVDAVHPEGNFFGSCFGPVEPPRPPALPAPPGQSCPAPSPAAFAAPPLPTNPARGDGSSVRMALLPEDAAPADGTPGGKGPQQGLIKLVLTLVNLLHEVLERQAVRRMDNGTLTPAQVEDVGTALYAQAMEIARLRQLFGLSESDLTLRLSASG